MDSFPREKVRNIGIVAHIDAGKTTTTERFLFYAGRTHRLGEVHDGQAIMDFRDDERSRGITISAASTTLDWHGCRIQLIDTPGHVDFTAEVERALRVLDGAVVVFDGVEGVEPQSETVWHQADRYGVPRVAFINKMDRVGADFDGSLHSMQERLKARPVAVQLPDGSAEDFRGIVDLVEQRYLQFDTASLGREIRSGSIPAALQEEASQRRAAMIETLAELHDPLAEAWLEERAITSGEIRSALRAVTIRREAVPVLCGAALRNVGIQPLLDAVCDYLPSPLEVPPVMGHDPATGEEISLPPNASAPFSALVFKVSAGASADLFYLRVYSGNLDAGERVLNPRTGEKERLRRILRMHADRGEPVERLEPGDIVAAAALHGSRTGDTLCSDGKPLLLEPIRFPSTVVTVAVEPRSGADRERFQEILPRLLREDPTLESHIDPDTGQTLLSGMGELHLEVVLGHLQRDFGLQLNSGNPRVSYRETALRKAGGEAEYSKLVGGEPLSAWVRLLFEPLENPSMPVEVLNGLLPGVVSAVMARGILESVRNAADGGGLFGYPVSGVRIHVSGARYAEVGQPEIALNSATSLAFREALRTAGSAVLEPYGRLEIRVPEEYLGAVVKTLHPRRAVVEETIVQRSGAVVRGVAPIAEMFGYLTSLRSHTQGRGTYSLEPLDFRPVPENLVRANHQRLYD